MVHAKHHFGQNPQQHRLQWYSKPFSQLCYGGQDGASGGFPVARIHQWMGCLGILSPHTPYGGDHGSPALDGGSQCQQVLTGLSLILEQDNEVF